VRGRRWQVLVVLALVVAASAAAVFGQTAADEAPGHTAVTASEKRGAAAPDPHDPAPLYDRTLKADLLDQLEQPPELVVLGGSRAMRIEPSYIRALTGLSAFNFAVRNNRPEDAYAIWNYVVSRAPAVKLRTLYLLQTTGFKDTDLHPVLLDDERFSQWLPRELVNSQKGLNGDAEEAGVPGVNRYTARGCLLYNGYDHRLARGVSLRWTLRNYIARLVPQISQPSASQDRSHRYFRKLLKACNGRGVIPAIVLMPYHPAVLEAFRRVGWQAQHDDLLDYLHELQRTYDLRVLDYTDIESFGGDARFFYDGAHLKKENSRRLLEQAVKDAPECF